MLPTNFNVNDYFLKCYVGFISLKFIKMKIKYVQKFIGADNSLEFTCEPCEGEYLDTKVQLNGVFLCCISFPDIEEFVKKLNSTIAEFAI